MTRITHATRKAVRFEAEKFLAEYGFTTPPLTPNDALAARDLKVNQLSLDDLLINANLTPADQSKVQAVLNMQDKLITFKEDLPIPKRNWGSLHEVGHEYLPWHKELLYYCSLLMLPVHVQTELEAEADIFAADTFFFGNKFTELVEKDGRNLATAKELADNTFKTSFHAAFIRLVEESDIPCCLLIWKPYSEGNGLFIPSKAVLQCYVKSPVFQGHFDPGQTTVDEAIVNLFSDPNQGVVKHEMEIRFDKTTFWRAQAESFCNVYNVFTLISNLKPVSSTRTKT